MSNNILYSYWCGSEHQSIMPVLVFRKVLQKWLELRIPPALSPANWAARFVMNLDWFRKQGLIFLNDFTRQSLELSLFSR